MESDDLLIAGFTGRTHLDSLVEIAQSVVKGLGFKLAQAAQRERLGRIGLKREKMVEGRDGRWEVVREVLQQAQVKPSFSPAGIESFCLPIELNGQGQIVLIAGGGGTRGQVIELRAGLLRLGVPARNLEKQKQEQQDSSRRR